MIKFNGNTGTTYYIAKWAIVSIYGDGEGNTYICTEKFTCTINETIEEALKLWETTE